MTQAFNQQADFKLQKMAQKIEYCEVCKSSNDIRFDVWTNFFVCKVCKSSGNVFCYVKLKPKILKLKPKILKLQPKILKLQSKIPRYKTSKTISLDSFMMKKNLWMWKLFAMKKLLMDTKQCTVELPKQGFQVFQDHYQE